MAEATKRALVQEFVLQAKKATTDDQQIECRNFVRDNLLPGNADRETRQDELLVVLNMVATHFDRARAPIAKDYELIIARIPESEQSVRQAVREIALYEGIIKAPAPSAQ